MSLSTLPSDVLFHIFIQFDDLQDLRTVVATNSSLFRIFEDHRVRVLQHVFRNQILERRDQCLLNRKPNPHFKDDRSTPATVLNFVNSMIRSRTTSKDELTLRATAWKTFISFESPFWVFGSLGKNLVALCEHLGQDELALSYAAELWTHLRIRQTLEYCNCSNRHVIDRDTNSFALKLAEMYFYGFDRPKEATQTIQECYSMNMRDRDFKLLSGMLVYSQHMSEQTEMLSFFHERAATERESLHAFGTRNCDLHSTFCLTMILSKLEKFQDAICVFNNIYDYFWESNSNPVTLEGLARRLIGSLKEQKHYDEAFAMHQQMLSLLARTAQVTTSQYMGWAKQYISELYALGRADDALVVEEQCWDRVRQRLTQSRERMYVFTGRNAAWSLSKSYERRGQVEHAKRVRKEYETLARACLKPGSEVLWPGEGSCAHLMGLSEYQDWKDIYKPINIGKIGHCTLKV